MKVTIKTWDAVASWKWDTRGEEDICGICRVQFDGTCPACKFPGDGCPIVIGKCSHSFHLHCAEEWIRQESSREMCPMCRQKFEAIDD